ncbi:MAG: Na+/H+ antiporter subunit E [Maricaulaceae bacterium]|nr:Na+/H+ antiporter subunit E [Maricaulaceae bacterium]
MLYGAGLGVVLAILWITLSGYLDKPLLLWLGAGSVAFAVFLTVRMRILDRETVPYARLPRLLFYYVWLGGQIFAANVAVLRAMLRPSIDITPRLTRVPAGQRTELGRTVFANSITLTPGTVTVEVEEDGFLVHGLNEDFIAPEGFRVMGEQAAAASDGGARK